MTDDQFKLMWEQQYEFMKLLQEKRNFPKFPVDIETKQGQKLLDDITFHIMKELFESNQHLKNSKSHRITEVPEIDRDAYIEELVDVLHLYLEICIAAGVSRNELFDAYMKKGTINTSRINNHY
jgi:predicted house-cleaning noncanonical NTP pyrophosphatase (MazG superfamily)